MQLRLWVLLKGLTVATWQYPIHYSSTLKAYWCVMLNCYVACNSCNIFRNFKTGTVFWHQKVRASMVTASLMRISSWSTMDLDGWAWQMQARTPTAHSSSSPLCRLHGSMANTSSLARFLRAWWAAVLLVTPEYCLWSSAYWYEFLFILFIGSCRMWSGRSRAQRQMVETNH